jgi:hypothetical protein
MSETNPKDRTHDHRKISVHFFFFSFDKPPLCGQLFSPATKNTSTQPTSKSPILLFCLYYGKQAAVAWRWSKLLLALETHWRCLLQHGSCEDSPWCEHGRSSAPNGSIKTHHLCGQPSARLPAHDVQAPVVNRGCYALAGRDGTRQY